MLAQIKIIKHQLSSICLSQCFVGHGLHGCHLAECFSCLHHKQIMAMQDARVLGLFPASYGQGYKNSVLTGRARRMKLKGLLVRSES